jgi:glucoamylase
MQPFDGPWLQQTADWEGWHADCRLRCALPSDIGERLRQEFLVSAMVLRSHQDKTYPGAMVASLSVPWGNSRGERGGYHLVWPRDLVECAGGLLALGGEGQARDILRYLIATQHQDGHWYQNQWLGGKPYWKAVQLDEAGFPVLLAAALAERGALNGIRVHDMVSRALAFIARTGPASDQDRWEENAGVNTFTLATCIAALVAGSQFLEPRARDFSLALADYWNAHIEEWTTVSGSSLARRLGVGRYYVRVAPIQALTDDQALRQILPIKNCPTWVELSAEDQVGVDFLQLVRFGLRRPDDPTILDSIKVIDALLRMDTPSGPAWHRYNGDGYGEHEDGSPFDGTGRGRAWPLLTGERGHYELAAGRDPLPYLEAMAAMSGPGGMIPEQVWDAPPIPERKLQPGRPTGAAMPLAWAHAEYIKLAISRQLGRPFDRPDAVWERYQGVRPRGEAAFWCEQAPVGHIAAGTRLTVCLHRPGTVHWGIDGWQHVQEVPTTDSGLGLHVAELDTSTLRAGQRVDFTYREADRETWAGKDRSVTVGKNRKSR